jgi:hypothetical protein
MTLSESLEKAIQLWQQMGVELLPPADERQVQVVMHQIKQRASADVVKLYQAVGGFHGVDRNCWSLFSLERVLKENAGNDKPQWRFSDGLIDSFFFNLQYENESVSSVWIDQGGDAIYQVADGLAEFFDIYLTDPTELWLTGGC